MDDVKNFWTDVEENEVKPILAKLEPHVRAEVLERLHAGDDRPDAELEKAVKEEATTETTETKAA